MPTFMLRHLLTVMCIAFVTSFVHGMMTSHDWRSTAAFVLTFVVAYGCGQAWRRR